MYNQVVCGGVLLRLSEHGLNRVPMVGDLRPVACQEKEVPKSSEGQLSLKVIRAMDLQETGVLKYQDPFVVIESSRARFETEVARGAGSDPEWKAAFELQVASGMFSSEKVKQ